MNKHILTVLVFVIVGSLVTAQKKQKEACDGLAVGDACLVGKDVAGNCQQQGDCQEASGCPLTCKVEERGEAKKAVAEDKKSAKKAAAEDKKSAKKAATEEKKSAKKSAAKEKKSAKTA